MPIAARPASLLLNLSGPPASVSDALQALRGSGFIYWGDAEAMIYAQTAAGGDIFNLAAGRDAEGNHVGPAAADELKSELRRALMSELDAAWRRDFANPLGDYDEIKGYMTLDFRRLVPIPVDVVRAGWKDAGEAWCMEHWGCRPIRHRASLEVIDQVIKPASGYYMVGGRLRKRRGATFEPQIRRVATIGFEADGDWPWPIQRALAQRWQDLYVNLEEDAGEEEAGLRDRRRKVNFSPEQWSKRVDQRRAARKAPSNGLPAKQALLRQPLLPGA